MKSNAFHFEVVTYIWQEGFRSFVFDEHDAAVWFDKLELAVDDLQGCFDIWSMQLKNGEREWGFDIEEFRIRCVETNAICNLGMSNNRIHLQSADSQRRTIDKTEFPRIDKTGIF